MVLQAVSDSRRAPMPQVVDLSRPGLPAVQRVLGWHPLHVAAMSGAALPLAPGCRAATPLPRRLPALVCTVLWQSWHLAEPRSVCVRLNCLQATWSWSSGWCSSTSATCGSSR